MNKALVIWGGWSGHEPKPCADVVEHLLQAEGFSVQVEEGTHILASQDLNDLSLIVPIMTMSKLAPEEGAALFRAVKGGVGLAGFHGGMGDAFRGNCEYNYMVGGQFICHPGGHIDYTVTITRPEDPIVAGISDFAYHSEQYYMHVDPSNEVLATTTFTGEHDFWIEGTVMPVVWKRHYGKGRVFYSALGHDAKEFEHPQMREIVRRGMLWASGGQ